MSIERARAVLPHVFEATVAAGWALVGLAYLANPDLLERSPVGREVHPFDTIWSVGYIAGAALVLAGVAGDRRPGIRVAGLVILGTALVMAGTAAASFALEPRVGVYLLHAAACWLRVASLVRVYRPHRG